MASTELVPEALIDREPETDDERAAKLRLIMDQTRELLPTEEIRVTCPCGFAVTVLTGGFKCFFCGIWLCRRCAARHFSRESRP